MRIVVCVKHVPDISSQRGFDSASRTVRTTEDSTLNEVDENAVEAALQFAEAAEQGAEVIALTMAPDIAVDAARRALQLGAGRGVHISDEALAGADYTVTARALAAAVRAEGSVDVVVTGMTALDGLGSVVPSLLAAELGWPQATVAREVELRDGAVTATRDVDGVAETWRMDLPGLVSVTDVTNEPRLPRMKEMMAARSKPVRTLTAADLGLGADEVAGRTRVRSAEPRPAREPEIVMDDGTGGRRIAEYLFDHGLIEPSLLGGENR